jgi:uncharacterized delta-60 repeat protein/uncharacterized repeat protein (TIGR01451 family)
VVTNREGTIQIYDLTGVTPSLLRTHAESIDPADVHVLDVPLRLESNLALTGIDSPDPVAKGANVTYSFVVTNTGPSVATGVRLVANLAEGISTVTATSTLGSCTFEVAFIGVTCAIGDMSVGATASVSMTVTVPEMERLSMSASVAADERDPQVDNNAVTIETTVIANAPPTSHDDIVSTLEDAPVTLDVLANDSDSDGDSLTVSMVTSPAHGTLVPGGGGIFTYVPSPNFNGADAFTYVASDGQLTGNTAAVSISILPVNDAPRFTVGPAVKVAQSAGPQTVPQWVTNISPGPSDESAQVMNFVVSVDDPALFSAQPAIGANGTLTYTPAAGRLGTAHVTVRLHDDGGTTDGGLDTSAPQSSTITLYRGLDAWCDGDGLATAPLQGYGGWQDVVVQPDGKVVAAGWLEETGRQADFVVARYDLNCALDSSFGTGGVAKVDFFNETDIAKAVVVQTDGRIVVGGLAHRYGGTHFYFGIARLNADGSPDDGTAADSTPADWFGEDGKVARPLVAIQESLADIVLQADGKIVAAGYVATPPYQVLVIRLNADGSPDPAFSGGWKVFQMAGQSTATSLVLQDDSKLVLGGVSDLRFTVARLNPDGTLDGSFGGGAGFVLSPTFSTGGAITDILVQPDGKIIAAGYTGRVSSDPHANQMDFTVVRYNSDGTLDQSFGSGGKVVTDVVGPNDVATGITREADGTIVVTGQAGFVGDAPDQHIVDFATVKYDIGGNVKEVLITDLFGHADSASRSVVQEGKLVVVGYGYDGPNQPRFGLVRYQGDSPAPADLVETDVANPPALLLPGARFTITDTVRNRGGLAARSSVTRYYLSTDTLKSAGDTRLGVNRTVPSLRPQEESTGGISAAIPQSMVTGTYYVLACADDTQIVPEGNEANNCTSSGSTVSVELPDLVESGLSEPPSVQRPGGKFSITETVRNASRIAAGASTTRYLLSADAVRDGSDVLLTGTRSVSSLPPDGTSTGIRTVTIPLNVPLGTYRVLACADDQGKVRESHESNNCVASSTMMSVALPDLVTTLVSNPPARAVPGGRFTAADTVMNSGVAAAAPSATRYYLSLDRTRDGSDVEMTGTRSIVSLVPGATSAGSKALTVPLTMVSGTYYLIACADSLNKVIESDEGNNCRASDGTTVVDSIIESGPFTYNGHVYYLLVPSTWKQAEQWARGLGGHLVTINDAAEDTFVFDTFAGYGGIPRQLWIGLNDEAIEGTFVWSSGEPVTYLNWTPGEPNNDSGNPLGEEDFAHIYSPNHPWARSWNDVSGLLGGTLPNNGVVEIPPR